MIRKIKPSDREALESLLNKIEHFSKNEADVAMELIDTANMNPNQTDYNIFVYEEKDAVLGYYCAGRRPLTDGVYDLYWIVSDPGSEVKGIGRTLLQHAEEFCRQNNARWILAETSSKESYARTRNFYFRNNYSIVAEINNFYSLGDNLIVFGKYLLNNK